MKKRVAILLHGLGPNGIDTLFANLSEYWDLEKYDITYFLAVDEGDLQFWEQKVLDAGVKIVHISDLDGTKLLKWPFKLSKTLKKYGPFDVIHVNMDMLNGINLYVAKKCKIPVRICHAHNTDNKNTGSGMKVFFKNKYLNIMKRLMKKNSTVRISCSERAGEYFYVNCSYHTIYNGIDLNKYKYNHQGSREVISFCTVGRITFQKNPMFIADIVNELYKLNKEIKFYWVGKGDLEKEVREYVNNLPSASIFEFLGVRDDVDKILSKCNYFLLPSRYEGFGLVLAEAQASGLDCFVSDAVPDIINCGKCKFISLNKTAAEWANVINDYIESEEQMILDKNLLDRFDISVMANRLEKYYSL